MKIKIKYFANDIKRISKFSKGDLIDLRAAETIKFNRGEYKLIPLGVGMILPKGIRRAFILAAVLIKILV